MSLQIRKFAPVYLLTTPMPCSNPPSAYEKLLMRLIALFFRYFFTQCAICPRRTADRTHNTTNKCRRTTNKSSKQTDRRNRTECRWARNNNPKRRQKKHRQTTFHRRKLEKQQKKLLISLSLRSFFLSLALVIPASGRFSSRLLSVTLHANSAAPVGYLADSERWHNCRHGLKFLR